MRYREILGKQVAAIALGSTEFGGATPEATAVKILDAYYDLGGNFIDTARMYGDLKMPRNGACEEIIGRWMEDRKCRDRIFLSTKGGHPPLGHMEQGRLSRGEILSDIHASLEALRTDHADIYWLHRDDPTRDVGDIMETLTELKESGLARMTGVSNWKPARIREANAYARSHGLAPLDGNQLQFSLARQMTVEDPTLVAMDEDGYRLHQEEGLLCCCFASLAKGFFTKLDASGPQGLSDKARRRYLSPENLAIYERMKTVREETGLSIHAISLAYLMAQPFPCFPLCGASRPEQIEALREAGDAEITERQRDYLRTIA